LRQFVAIISETAQSELDEAYLYYESVDKGLGDTFKEEIDGAVKRVLNFPFISEKVTKNVRRHLIPRFSYAIFYSVDEKKETILILSVGHQHREPRYR